MMKKLFLFLLLAVMALKANAQLQIGLKGGFNVTRVSLSSNLADNISYNNREGYFAGLSVKFPLYIVLPISIEASALYNQMWTGVDKTTVERESFAFPINAQLKLTKHTFIYAGPQLDFNLNDDKFNIYNISSSVKDYSLKDANVSVNVGGGIHVGHLQCTVNFNRALGAYTDINLQTAVDGATDVIRGSAKADSWWVGLTYFF